MIVLGNKCIVRLGRQQAIGYCRIFLIVVDSFDGLDPRWKNDMSVGFCTQNGHNRGEPHTRESAQWEVLRSSNFLDCRAIRGASRSSG